MREAAQQFLSASGWADAVATPIADDLSVRRYFRLTRGEETAVLMDDRPGIKTSLPAFVAMTHWLKGLELSAPKILDQDMGQGFLLLEDLGQMPVSGMPLNSSQRATALDTSIELLLYNRKAKPPALPQPKAGEFCEWTTMADAYYPGADGVLLGQFRSVLETVLQRLCQEPASVSLRDFHADNLMWLPERSGVARLGLLDYQDAMLTHPVYDLVSLLTDARSEVSKADRQHYIWAYTKASGDDPEAFAEAFAAFSLQRNLRILGIFHRSAQVDGKSHHLPKVPRVYRYLKEALEHPIFASLRPNLSHALPPPKGAT